MQRGTILPKTLAYCIEESRDSEAMEARCGTKPKDRQRTEALMTTARELSQRLHAEL